MSTESREMGVRRLRRCFVSMMRIKSSIWGPGHATTASEVSLVHASYTATHTW